MPKTKQQEAQEKRLQANIQQARKNRSAVKKAGKKSGPHAKPPGKGGFFSGVKRDAPQTAQQTIPYREIYKDGICRVNDKLYTKTIQFFDINYQLAQADDKAQIFEELQYVEVLATTSDKGSDNTYNDGEVNANAEDEEDQSLYATVTIILQDRAQALRLAECENTSLHAIFVCRGDEEYKQKCLKAQLDLLTGGADETAEATSEADTEEAQPAMNIPENKNQNNAPAGSEEAAHGA